jgi:hypothetical protein
MSMIPAAPVFTIAALEPGVFWCAPLALGVPEEEIEAFKAGKLSDKRRQEIGCMIQLALNTLRNAEIPGTQFWMSPKRMVS